MSSAIQDTSLPPAAPGAHIWEVLPPSGLLDPEQGWSSYVHTSKTLLLHAHCMSPVTLSSEVRLRA